MKRIDEILPLVAILAAAIALSTKKAAGLSFLGRNDLPIGLRNNNPGNIIKSPTAWKGEIPSDNRFERFENIVYGVRALMANLRSYYFNRSLKTISEIINRWAPPIENDTASYVSFVSSHTGIPRDKVFEWNERNVSAISKAIVIVEVGAQYATMIPDSVYFEAWKIL